MYIYIYIYTLSRVLPKVVVAKPLLVEILTRPASNFDPFCSKKVYLCGFKFLFSFQSHVCRWNSHISPGLLLIFWSDHDGHWSSIQASHFVAISLCYCISMLFLYILVKTVVSICINQKHLGNLGLSFKLGWTVQTYIETEPARKANSPITCFPEIHIPSRSNKPPCLTF